MGTKNYYWMQVSYNLVVEDMNYYHDFDLVDHYAIWNSSSMLLKMLHTTTNEKHLSRVVTKCVCDDMSSRILRHQTFVTKHLRDDKDNVIRDDIWGPLFQR